MRKRSDRAYWLSITDWIHYIPPRRIAADQLCAIIYRPVTLPVKVELLHCVITPRNFQQVSVKKSMNRKCAARQLNVTNPFSPGTIFWTIAVFHFIHLFPRMLSVCPLFQPLLLSNPQSTTPCSRFKALQLAWGELLREKKAKLLKHKKKHTPCLGIKSKLHPIGVARNLG